MSLALRALALAVVAAAAFFSLATDGCYVDDVDDDGYDAGSE